MLFLILFFLNRELSARATSTPAAPAPIKITLFFGLDLLKVNILSVVFFISEIGFSCNANLSLPIILDLSDCIPKLIDSKS